MNAENQEVLDLVNQVIALKRQLEDADRYIRDAQFRSVCTRCGYNPRVNR